MTIRSWGSEDVPLLPRVLRDHLGERPCPDAVLNACAPSTGSLAMLDARQLRPNAPRWPADALQEILQLVSAEFAATPTLRDTPIGHHPDVANHLVSQLSLATRSRNCLRRASLRRVRDLSTLAWTDLLALRNSGVRTLLDVLCALEEAATEVEADVADTQQVLEHWTNITRLELSAQLTQTFHAQAAHLRLATWPEDELRSAGSRVFALTGALQLPEWADELAQPGTAVICTIPERWIGAEEHEADVLRQALTDMLTQDLDDRICAVMRQWYGIAGSETRTLADIGSQFGVSRERVRQLREKGLRRILASASGAPMTLAIISTLEHLVQRGGPEDAKILELADLVLPETPMHRSVALIARLIGYDKDRCDELVTQLRNQLRTAAREERQRAAEDFRRKRSRDAATARLDALRHESWWPDDLVDRSSQVASPVRVVGEEESVPPYSLSSAKMGREIAAESTIELAFFSLCESCPDVDWYCEQPAAIDYYFDGRRRRYFPDAMVSLRDGKQILVEVKNLMECSLAVNQAKWAAARRWCAEQGVGFLVTDGRRTLRAVETHQPNPDHVHILADCLAAGPMSWLDVVDLRREVGFSALDLTAAILAKGWSLRQGPWRLALTS